MSKKGFTLIELVVVIGIIVLFCGFSIVTISTIPQIRMKKFAEEIKSNFELARDFSKTHGGTISLYIKKTDDGLEMVRDVRETNKRDDYQIKAETVKISDNKIELFYFETGKPEDEEPKRLGDGGKNELEFQFSQTDGSIIGPDFLDYVIISNGNKTYKLIIMQRTGQVYFDYEMQDNYVEKNDGASDTKVVVDLPVFNDKQNASVGVINAVYMMERKDGLSTLQPPIKYDSRYVKISGVYRATDANPHEPYIIYFDLKDPNGTEWNTSPTAQDPDAKTSTKILKWNIVD